ncbi:hypothetical protein ACP70R_043359 [Stipagrostis hirtigluma subsp. patula]
MHLGVANDREPEEKRKRSAGLLTRGGIRGERAAMAARLKRLRRDARGERAAVGERRAASRGASDATRFAIPCFSECELQ